MTIATRRVTPGMKVVAFQGGRLDNGAYGYPKGSKRRHKPTIRHEQDYQHDCHGWYAGTVDASPLLRYVRVGPLPPPPARA